MYIFMLKWKKVISNPFFSVICVLVLGFLISVIFQISKIKLAIVTGSIIILLTILITVIIAIFKKKEVSSLELSKVAFEKSKYNVALKFIDLAIKEESNEDLSSNLYIFKAKILEKMKLHEEEIAILKMSINKSINKYQWEAFYKLAILYRMKYGTYSNEALEMYIKCRELRVKFNIPSNDQDIRICRIISEIYDYNNMKSKSLFWFLREMAIRESLLDINTKEKSELLLKEARAKCDKNENLSAILIYNKVIELLEPKLSKENILIAEVYLALGDLYYHKINDSKSISNAILNYKIALNIRKKYHGETGNKVELFLRKSFESFKQAIEKFAIDGDKYYSIARKYLYEYNMEEAIKYKNLAEASYKNAILLAKEIYGETSIEVANLCRKLGLCYKWITVSRNDIKNAKYYFFKTKKIWDKNFDRSVYNVKISNLLDDIGGLFSMEGNYNETIRYRTEAYHALKKGKYDVENLARIELSIRITFEKIQKNKSVEELLKERNVTPLIESYEMSEMGIRKNKCIVKIKNRNEPYVWLMG